MKIANVVLGDVCVKPDWTRLRDWLKGHRPDRRPGIVTLQKIGPSEPRHEEEIRKVGYEGWYLNHKENYLGVAILADRDFPSRHDPSPPSVLDRKLPDDDRNESRFLTVSIGDLLVSSIYAPYCKLNGPTVDWLNYLRTHVCNEGFAQRKSLLCGDFNVPKIDDKSKGRLKQALGELKELGFCDLYRQAHPCPEEMPGYTRHCGRKYPSRLHLILASRSLAQRLGSAYMEPEPGLWPRKDAPPLVVCLDDIECANG